tara:strand:- start:305 stop:676 length:372 start_codon:yes stop_codon:yes gene_type:complete
MKHVYSKGNQYAERDIEALGNYYMVHIDAMTVESLYSKSSVAAELAFRDKRIAQLETQWISVEDRLPGFHEYVLSYHPVMNVTLLGSFIQGSHRFRDVMSNSFYKSDISHWMPLPSPPKEAQR